MRANFTVGIRHVGNAQLKSNPKQPRRHLTSQNDKWTVPQALEALGLSHRTPPPPSKELIQEHFAMAAKKYHPDAKHSPSAQPCAIRFREACEAQTLLLQYYHEGPMAIRHFQQDLRRRQAHQRPRSTSQFRQDTANRRFAQGFPHQTLQVLTLKQNLAIRGTIGLCLILGMLSDFVSKTRQKHQWAPSESRVGNTPAT